VVVGGRNSNNTRELVELCRLRGTRTFQVRDAGDLQTVWFQGIECVGLAAGTSALDSTIREVREWLYRHQPGRAETPEQRHSRQWIEYYQQNRDRLLTMPWHAGSALTAEDRALLI